MPREHNQSGENMLEKVYTFAKKTVIFINSVAGLYLLWILIHYVSAHLYVYYCAHGSFIGLIMSPILVSAPHCRALRWAIYTGAQSIDAMWIVLGTWVCSKLLINSNNRA